MVSIRLPVQLPVLSNNKNKNARTFINKSRGMFSPDSLRVRLPRASQIYCDVTFPVTKKVQTFIFPVATGAVLTIRDVLYANTIALQKMAEGNEEKVGVLDQFKYNGRFEYTYSFEANAPIVRCKFELFPVDLWHPELH